MNNLVQALVRVTSEKEIQSSGNLKSKLQELEEEVREEIADAFHGISGFKPEAIFQLGLDLGRDIRQKTVYGVEIDRVWYYFVGTENEIIQRIEAVEGGSENEEKQDLIEDLDRALR